MLVLNSKEKIHNYVKLSTLCQFMSGTGVLSLLWVLFLFHFCYSPSVY